MVQQIGVDGGISIRRLARVLEIPVATVGRWLKGGIEDHPRPREIGRRRPISGDERLQIRLRECCAEPRHAQYGYRRIWALLRREGWRVNRKTVWRVMRELGLSRPKVWHRPRRPKRVEKMRPHRPHQSWQIDMTSLVLSNLEMLFLVVVIDCYTRQILGWTLDRRCRASEWVAAVRQALEGQGLAEKLESGFLVLRSDNGAQPCAKRFVEFLGQRGIQAQYTGYNAPDDNAYVERVIRTIKEEEIWPSAYETFGEAHQAIQAYLEFYNEQRIHAALGYRTPNEFAAAYLTLAAA